MTHATSAHAQSWRPEPDKGPSPSKEQLAEAKERYERGVKLYDDEGSVQAALVEFERAYDLAPNFRVLYNIGQGARTLRDYATALRAFESYLSGGQDKIPKARAAEVTKDIAQLRTFVATLTVEVDVEGAVVTVDGAAVGTSPLKQPLLVNAGRSTVAATKAGRVGTTTVNLAGGDVRAVRLEVPVAATAPEAAAPVVPPPPPTSAVPAPSPPPDPPPPAPRAPDRTAAYLSFGIGSALAVAAGVTGYSALRASSDLEKKRFAGPRPSSEAESLQGRTQRLALVSDVLTGTAVLAVGIGVALILTEGPSKPRAGKAQAQRGTASSWPTRASTYVSFYIMASGAGVYGAF